MERRMRWKLPTKSIRLIIRCTIEFANLLCTPLLYYRTPSDQPTAHHPPLLQCTRTRTRTRPDKSNDRRRRRAIYIRHPLNGRGMRHEHDQRGTMQAYCRILLRKLPISSLGSLNYRRSGTHSKAPHLRPIENRRRRRRSE